MQTILPLGALWQRTAAAWTKRKKEETTLWWIINFFSKRGWLKQKPSKETTRADWTMDLLGLEDLNCRPMWPPERAWSCPCSSFGPHVVDLRATPLITLRQLQCGLAGWLHKFPANLLFSVSTLVLNRGVSVLLPPWKPNHTLIPATLACPLEGLTNGKDWNGLYFTPKSPSWLTSSSLSTCLCFPFSHVIWVQTGDAGWHGNDYVCWCLMNSLAVRKKSLILFLIWILICDHRI